MPVDPSISLGVNPPGQALGSTLGMVGSLAQIQNALNQNRLFQQEFMAKQKAGAIISQSPDLETGIANMYRDPDVAAFAPGIVNGIRQTQLTMQQIAETKLRMTGQEQDMMMKGQQGFMQGLAGTGGDENQIAQVKKMYLAGQPPELQQSLGKSFDAVTNALTDGLPSDPQARKAELDKRLVAIPMGAGLDVAKTYAAQGAIPPQAGTPGPYGPGGAPTQPIIGGVGGGGPAGQTGGSVLDSAGVKVPAGAISSSGTPMGPTQAQSEYNVSRTKDVVDYEKNLDDRVLTGAGFRRNMDEIIDAAHNAQIGGGADVYMKLGQGLQALGISNPTVDKWANGSLASSQVIDKASLNNVMAQLKQQLTGVGGSRINQMEFIQQLSKNPGITTDPRAMVQVFNLWNSFYDKDRVEQAAMDEYKSKGGDITRWPSIWAKSDYMKQFASTSPISGEGVKGTQAAPLGVGEFRSAPGGITIKRVQ